MRSVLLVSVAALTAGFLLHGCMPEAECNEKQAGALPASVRILLPNSHAKLTINGKVMPAKKGSRRFVTPPLEKSKNYTYTFQAEFVRGHKTMTIGRKVKLHAGEKKVVSSAGRARPPPRAAATALMGLPQAPPRGRGPPTAVSPRTMRG